MGLYQVGLHQKEAFVVLCDSLVQTLQCSSLGDGPSNYLILESVSLKVVWVVGIKLPMCANSLLASRYSIPVNRYVAMLMLRVKETSGGTVLQLPRSIGPKDCLHLNIGLFLV